MGETQKAAAPEGPLSPLIIDLGKQKKAMVRALSKGKKGRLRRKIDKQMAHLTEVGAVASGPQPIYIVVKEKPKKKKKKKSSGGMPGWFG